MQRYKLKMAYSYHINPKMGPHKKRIRLKIKKQLKNGQKISIYYYLVTAIYYFINLKLKNKEFNNINGNLH
jgi:hypothetical protein